MLIYSSEKDLSDTISANCNASLCVGVKLSGDEKVNADLFLENLNSIKASGCDARIERAIAKMSEHDHPDLMYGSAILVSTVMNRNDDMFTASEVWKARHTPVNTPYNNDHKEDDIIGHIIAARVLNEDGEVLADDTTEIPDYFDIEVDFVVYKTIFPDIAAEIIEQAPKGQKFVSMEARMTNFDYVIMEEDGQAKIIARNEDTAFLTKYLRIYGGPGIYDGKKIGRVVKDFRFIGMGNVDKPANPASEYTKLEANRLVYCEESIDLREETKLVLLIAKDKIMKVESLEQAQTELEKLVEIEATLKSEKDALASELETEKSKSEVAQQKIEELQGQLDSTKAELETANTELAAKINELDEIAKAAKTETRVAKLVELGVKVDDEKRAKVAAWSDEQFDSLVEFTAGLVKEKTEEPTVTAEETLETEEIEETPAVENTAGEQQETIEDRSNRIAAKLVEVVRASRKANPSK